MERGKSEPIGVSFAFDEAVWGDKYANLQFKLDIEDHLNVPGQVIWNPELDGVTEFLHILYMEGVNCWADTLTNNPLLGALFDAGAFCKYCNWYACECSSQWHVIFSFPKHFSHAAFRLGG